jgi:hypothetical protein
MMVQQRLKGRRTQINTVAVSVVTCISKVIYQCVVGITTCTTVPFQLRNALFALRATKHASNVSAARRGAGLALKSGWMPLRSMSVWLGVRYLPTWDGLMDGRMDGWMDHHHQQQQQQHQTYTLLAQASQRATKANTTHAAVRV